MATRRFAARRLLAEALEPRQLLSSASIAGENPLAAELPVAGESTAEYTQVFGENGDLWNPADETLIDFSYAGYHQGLNDYPDWPVGANVRDFGAVGDGVADDTQAFLDAMEACPSNHVVYIPNGTYKLMDWLGVEAMIGLWVKPNPKSNFAFRGEDRDDVVLLLGTGLQDIHPWDRTNGNGDPTTQWSWYGGFLWFQNCEEVGVENLTIKGTGTEYGVHFADRGYNGIYFRDVENAWVRDVTFINIECGILTRSSQYMTYQNLRYESTPEWPCTVDTDYNLGMSGHHGMSFQLSSNWCLADNIEFTNMYHHELTLSDDAHHCVFSNIRGERLHFDFHTDTDNLPNNLFTQIDVGDGSLMWRNNYYGACSDSVFWNITGENITLPVEVSWVTHPVLIEDASSLLVGWPIDLPDIQDVGGPWFEDISPETIAPQNIYYAQRALRLGGNDVYLEGTLDAADVIEVWPGTPGGAFHRVEINGTATTYDPSIYDAIYVDGLGGNDTLTFHGSDQDESVTIGDGSVDVEGDYYEFHAVNVGKVNANAGTGSDDVTLFGSMGSNRFYSYPDHAVLSDSPRSYAYRVDDFDSVTVDAPHAGRDYALFYDGPDDDELDADPDRVLLNRAVGMDYATVTIATGFERVYAYATQGGDDMVRLNGSDTGRNRFYGYDNHSLLSDSTRSLYFYARGFDSVWADSPSMGTSYAYLYDSPGFDLLTAGPDSVTFDRAEGSADTTATGFKRVYAYSTRGGDDEGEMTGNSAGGNQFRATPDYATLTDSIRSFYHYARGFRSVRAIGSPDAPLTDRAYLYDSREDDTLTARGDSALLTDTAEAKYEIEALYFDYVYARSTDRSTTDTIDADDTVTYTLIRFGTW